MAVRMDSIEYRICKILTALVQKRDKLLNEYLEILEIYSQSTDKNVGMTVIEAAGMIHDIDRHITNLNLELKHLEAIKHA